MVGADIAGGVRRHAAATEANAQTISTDRRRRNRRAARCALHRIAPGFRRHCTWKQIGKIEDLVGYHVVARIAHTRRTQLGDDIAHRT